MKQTGEETPPILSALRYDAAIFDLDGVVTRTAALHAKAWKETFDPLLEAQAGKGAFRPFDIRKDYLTYVDGRPRLDGIRTFLTSRGIELPEGQPDDPEDAGTVYALGNKKNRCFLALLQQGVKLYEPAIELILKLKNFGLATAIVSSSKNCKAVLESANITGLFDTIVDGVDLQHLDLKGKPEPDLFLEAAKRLGVDPVRAIVFEDAVAGVEAGRKGGFGNVIGVDRVGHAEALKTAGADHVVTTLAAFDIRTGTAELPSALDSFETIEKQLKDRETVLFLDFDGTLTPIVPHPKDANLSEAMKTLMIKLSNQCTIAIVSGRGLGDIKSRVGIKGIYYAGSHGFEIEGPGLKMEYEPALAFIERLDVLEAELKSALDGVEGAYVERKKFSIALHYRNVPEAELPRIDKAAAEGLRKYPELRKTLGKKVYELQPNLAWDKGRAVEWLEDALRIDRQGSKIIYIGDDITDEDAFHAIQGYGIGMLVDGGETRSTAAHYRLEGVDSTQRFLETLSATLERGNIWALAYSGYEPGKEMLREVLCALGNGYFVTRAAFPGARADGVHYPGTYLAGGYNRLKSGIAGREVKNEDLVNLPDWLVLRFRIDGGEWCSIDRADILFFRQELDIKEGVLHRLIHLCDAKGRETRVIERRLVHMADKHIAAQELTIIPVNWSGAIEVESGINGNIKNEGVKRYRKLANRHLRLLEREEADGETLLLKMQTAQSELTVAQTIRTRVYRDNDLLTAKAKTVRNQAYIARRFRIEKLSAGEHLHIEKSLALYTSKDSAISNPALEALLAAQEAKRFEALLGSHRIAWKQLWDHFDFRLELSDEAQDHSVIRTLHLYAFHLLQTASIHSLDMDVGIPARGWHGEAYRGHIFWDEVIIFPFFNYRLPHITRSLIFYRYRRLKEARRAAGELGYKGAMYPWQSGSNGKEETQKLHLNPRSRRWLPDNSYLQRHVNASIVYTIWHYYEVSGDFDFLFFYGAEMIVEIARFWASIATYNEAQERYEIIGVMGPDEYHDGYPGSDTPGLRNNAYTNVMAVFVFNKALELRRLLSTRSFNELCERLQIEAAEIERWEEIRTKMKIPFHDEGIISQFEGYEALEELDWEHYRQKYGDIQRLDRILEAEKRSTNNYKVSKQADVTMLFYLFSNEELEGLFKQLGYPFDADMIRKNIDYYLQRTSNGSSLSQVIHAWVNARMDREKSWEFFNEALMTDIEDSQGGTTPEGIHLGAMAGSIDIVQRCYTGLETRGDVLRLNPSLPAELRKIELHLHYRRQWLHLVIRTDKITIRALDSCARPIAVEVKGERFMLESGTVKEIIYSKEEL